MLLKKHFLRLLSRSHFDLISSLWVGEESKGIWPPNQHGSGSVRAKVFGPPSPVRTSARNLYWPHCQLSPQDLGRKEESSHNLFPRSLLDSEHKVQLLRIWFLHGYREFGKPQLAPSPPPVEPFQRVIWFCQRHLPWGHPLCPP